MRGFRKLFKKFSAKPIRLDPEVLKVLCCPITKKKLEISKDGQYLESKSNNRTIRYEITSHGPLLRTTDAKMVTNTEGG